MTLTMSEQDITAAEELHYTTTLKALEQLLQDKKTGKLEVHTADGPIRIFILHGLVFNSEAEGKQGLDALKMLLTESPDAMYFDPSAKLPSTQNTQIGLQELDHLAAAMGLKDDKDNAAVQQGAQRLTLADYPLPSGVPIYVNLDTSFVDFFKLLLSLERQQFTGYIRYKDDKSCSLTLAILGNLVACAYDAGDLITFGVSAVRMTAQSVKEGIGSIDVNATSDDMVKALSLLFSSRPKFTNLRGSFVRLPQLVDYLKETEPCGLVSVRSSNGIGVIIFSSGAIISTLAEVAGEQNAMDFAYALAEEPDAIIDAHVSDEPSQLEPIPYQVLIEDTFTDSLAVPSRSSSVTFEEQTDTSSSDAKYSSLLQEYQVMAEKELGGKSKKIKEILSKTPPEYQRIEDTIGEIEKTTILFVDSAKIKSLADQMRSRLEQVSKES
jgi:hypothetical protein